jgi:hypothetical protein
MEICVRDAVKIDTSVIKESAIIIVIILVFCRFPLIRRIPIFKLILIVVNNNTKYLHKASIFLSLTLLFTVYLMAAFKVFNFYKPLQFVNGKKYNVGKLAF